MNQPRGRRGSRRVVQAPTRLPGEPVFGVIEGALHEATAPEPAKPAGSGASGGGDAAPSAPRTPAVDPLLEALPESESDSAWGDAGSEQERSRRDAWYLEQRPPHWG